MSELTHVPDARPVSVTASPVPSEIPTAHPLGAYAPGAGIVRVPKDPFAVASAACGLAAIVPILFQVIGLVLGTIGLLRIRRARRNGVRLGGTVWAISGIVTSGFALVCWIGIFVAFNVLGSSLSNSVGSLSGLAQPMQMSR
jgi:hypothetical protein